MELHCVSYKVGIEFVNIMRFLLDVHEMKAHRTNIKQYVILK